MGATFEPNLNAAYFDFGRRNLGRAPCATTNAPAFLLMAAIAIGGMLAIPSPGMYPECIKSLLSETSGGQIQTSAILIRCRRTNRVVPTGLTAENVKFISLAGIQFSIVCPVCGGIHRWKQRDAWVEGSNYNRKTPKSARPDDAGAASGLASAGRPNANSKPPGSLLRKSIGDRLHC